MKRKRTALVKWAKIAAATGYKVFWGTTSRVYPNSKDVGNTLSYRVPGLQAGRRYYFSAKSYNANLTSKFGNEIAYTP